MGLPRLHRNSRAPSNRVRAADYSATVRRDRFCPHHLYFCLIFVKLFWGDSLHLNATTLGANFSLMDTWTQISCVFKKLPGDGRLQGRWHPGECLAWVWSPTLCLPCSSLQASFPGGLPRQNLVGWGQGRSPPSRQGWAWGPRWAGSCRRALVTCGFAVVSVVDPAPC